MKIYIRLWENDLIDFQDCVFVEMGNRSPVLVDTFQFLKTEPELFLQHLQEVINKEYSAAIAEAFRNSLIVDITE